MGKQKIVGKRWMSALLALILTVTLLPAPSAAADDSLNVENAIQNPGFETPSIRTTSSQMPQENVQDWETTAKEGMIEFGGNWNGHTAPHYSTSRDKNNAEGYQFAELNADEESTLYQNVTTVGGNVYEWGLQHRGRIGVDKMALIIGPKQETAPSKPIKNGRDQYMQLTDWVQANQAALGFTIPDDGCSQRLTVYSKPFGENGAFLGGSGSESPFSTKISNIYTERWDVWIIATDNQRWVGYGIKDNAYQGDKGVGGGLSYECSYLVPDGQTQTTFAFCSYSSTAPAGSLVPKTFGNLIGPDASAPETFRYSCEKQVTDRTPQAFIALSDDDDNVLPGNSTRYYTALKSRNVPAELHIFPTGGHGWGWSESFRYKDELRAALGRWLEEIRK